jgi:hypothetical protein
MCANDAQVLTGVVNINSKRGVRIDPVLVPRMVTRRFTPQRLDRTRDSDFTPKGLDKSAQGQRSATLGMGSTSPFTLGYINGPLKPLFSFMYPFQGMDGFVDFPLLYPAWRFADPGLIYPTPPG